MTSAPWSASSMPAPGAKTNWASSTTRTPANTPLPSVIERILSATVWHLFIGTINRLDRIGDLAEGAAGGGAGDRRLAGEGDGEIRPGAERGHPERARHGGRGGRAGGRAGGGLD